VERGALVAHANNMRLVALQHHAHSCKS
jgi:hypothetical protein